MFCLILTTKTFVILVIRLNVIYVLRKNIRISVFEKKLGYFKNWVKIKVKL